METTQKDRIIEEAMRMFVEQGIKSVRMDDIARSLGMSKRTLYELFDDKEELLFLAMHRYFDEQHERTHALCAESSDVLMALFLALNQLLDTAPASARLVDNLKKFYPAVYKRLLSEGQEKNIADFRRMLETGVKQGLFITDFNFDLAISMLFHAAEGLIRSREIIVPVGMTERDAFVQIIGTFFRGISTRKGLELVDEYKRRYTPPAPKLRRKIKYKNPKI